MMTEAQKAERRADAERMAGVFAEGWKGDYEILIRGICRECGLTLTEAMLYYAITKLGGLQNQLHWRNEVLAKNQPLVEQQKRLLDLQEQILKEQAGDDEDWKKGGPDSE